MCGEACMRLHILCTIKTTSVKLEVQVYVHESVYLPYRHIVYLAIFSSIIINSTSSSVIFRLIHTSTSDYRYTSSWKNRIYRLDEMAAPHTTLL